MFLQVSSLCKSLCRSTECLLLESWQMLAEARPCNPCIASRPCPKVDSREKSVQAIWIIWTVRQLECEAIRVAFFRAAFFVVLCWMLSMLLLQVRGLIRLRRARFSQEGLKAFYRRHAFHK